MSDNLVQKVLIIGSGPVRIGQCGALDQAARRACGIFRQAGVQTVMVHCDPSSLAADPEAADGTYLVPLTVGSLTEIVLKEKPDALFPVAGGPLALGLAKSLNRAGLIEGNGMRWLGISASALEWIDEPSAFFSAVDKLGLAAPIGQSSASLSDAAEAAERIGYPVFVRAAEQGGGIRYGMAFNVEELRLLATGGRLPSEDMGACRVEKALASYREVEAVLLRDTKNRMQVVAIAENMDPVGIHSGDSLAVIPPLTITKQTRKQIETAACTLAEHARVTGVLHFKFAVEAGAEPLILAMDPCFTRMAAFCGNAFGIDLAAIHARLCMGAELDAAIDGDASAIAGAMDGRTVAVRLPRWEFERFPGETVRLGARMRSTGEVMGLGRNLLEAFQKAVHNRSPRHPVFGFRNSLYDRNLDDLMRDLVLPSPERIDQIYEALKKGAAVDGIAAATGIDIAWIRHLADLVALDIRLTGLAGQPLPSGVVKEAVAAGMDETRLAALLGISSEASNHLLSDADIKLRPSAAGGSEQRRVWFTSRSSDHWRHAPMGKTILIVGPGVGRIGQNIELDHCCVHAARALHTAGRRVVLVNANSAAAYGINDVDRIYAESLTATDLIAVCQSEKPEGVILQFGGYAAMDLAPHFSDAGFAVWGTPHFQADLSQDRLRFSRLLTELGIPHPQIGVADSPEQAMDLAETIGYPLVINPPADRLGSQRTIIRDVQMMEHHVVNTPVSPSSPLLLEQFLEYAIEVEADALCDGKMVYVPAAMEHIELAGVHSGDAAMVAPPYSTPPRHVDTISAYVRKIALELDIIGVLNTRFAVYNDTVYLLAARPWACRTLPFISKVCDIPMAQRAVEIMLGMNMDAMDLPRRLLPHYAIRSSVFPFDTFGETDPLMGPRMRSTGQAMVLADGFGMAYFTSQEAAGPPLPLQGNVLITVTDADKPSILEPARLFKEMGFGIQATRGTHMFLKKNGIDAQLVKKLGFGRPDLVDSIKTGAVTLVVNTPSGRQSQQDDAHIRKTAIRYNIPNITTPAAALAAAKGIAARKQGQDALRTLQSYVRALK